VPKFSIIFGVLSRAYGNFEQKMVSWGLSSLLLIITILYNIIIYYYYWYCRNDYREGENKIV